MRVDEDTKKWTRGVADEIAVEHGCRFNLQGAERVGQFFRQFLRHSKGKWRGVPFELLDWQWNDVIAPLFGWRRDDGTRRYREAYVEVPKKNGKSELAAGIADYLLIMDGEQGGEVYCAATDRKQAGIVHGVAASMIKQHKDLRSRCIITPSTKTIAYPETDSTFRALCGDDSSNEGWNWHGLIFDELHAQPNRRLWDTLYYGNAAREQPLLFSITTAGWDRSSVCWERHTFAENVRDGIWKDWEFLPVIYGADPKDDWADPAVWREANPSLGVTIQEGDLRRACKQAQESPMHENAFKRYRLNLWTEQAERWLPMAAWHKCKAEPITEGICFGGLDLAERNDLAALALYWPETNSLKAWFWLPEDLPSPRDERVKDMLRAWGHQGHIEMTPGNVIDFTYIRRRINEVAKEYNLAMLGYDPARATQLAIQLKDEDGLPIAEAPQSFTMTNEPAHELYTLVLAEKLRHGGNPVLDWCASNVVVRPNADGHIKIDKGKSADKVDGITSAVMAIGLAVRDDSMGGKSVYEDRGLVFV